MLKKVVERVELEGVSTEADVGAGCWSCMALFVKKARFTKLHCSTAVEGLRRRLVVGPLG